MAWNLQCALVYWLKPEAYSATFELTGIPGAVALRGTALLFIMWNVPYLVALWHPLAHRLSLWEALVMQAIGLGGESVILFMLPAGYAVLRASILRFIAFDAAGLVLLAVAIVLTAGLSLRRNPIDPHPGE